MKPSTAPRIPSHTLTTRERQVLLLLAQGLPSAAVAARLGASVHTVRKHRSNMLCKLGVRNIAALVSHAVHLGYLHVHAAAGQPRGNAPRCRNANSRS
jgi:DNA-binding CsgD family transcriptional regulator